MIATQSPTTVALAKKQIDARFRLPDSWWQACREADETKKKAAERRATAASCPYLRLVTDRGVRLT